MKRRLFGILLATAMLSAVSCSTEKEPTVVADPYASDNTARVRVAVGVEGLTQTRAEDPEDPDGNTTGGKISDGTRATTLIYALYNANGAPVKIANPNYKEGEDSTGERLVTQATIKNVSFPYNDLPAFDLVKGLEYTLVFWAQSEGADTYYNTTDLTNIQITYTGANNDEARDAFCARYKLTLSQSDDEKEVSITLKRPFAQINVGFTKEGYNRIKEYKGDFAKSSITVKYISKAFNLFADSTETDSGNIVNAEYATATIPASMAGLGEQVLEVDLNNDHQIADDEKFVWVSMCYILAPDYNNGTSTYSTTVDIDNLRFYFGDDTEYTDGSADESAETPEGAETPDAAGGEGTENADGAKAGTAITRMTFVPVQRNHRTNILFDPSKDVPVVVHLDPTYEGEQTIYGDGSQNNNWRPSENGGADNGTQGE